MLKLVSLANGYYDFLSIGTITEIKKTDILILQTEKIDCAPQLKAMAKEYYTLDFFYAKASDFDELYQNSSDFIIEAAREKQVVFGVFGSLSSNGIVAELRKKIEFDVIPGASFESIAQFFSGKYFDIGAMQCIAAFDIRQLNVDSTAAIVVTQIDSRFIAFDVKLFLSDYFDNSKIVFINGCTHFLIDLMDLDKQETYGTGACIVVPRLDLLKRTRFTFYDLISIMQKLRGLGGCPWDLEQTHQSLRQFVLEEAYEVVDAIDTKDGQALADELGDLLLQVVFHAEIGRQSAEFDILDVITNICSKMISRHTHIFGDVTVADAGDVVLNWETIKRAEKNFSTYTQTMTDIPKGMSALMRSVKIQKKAAQAGFDWKNAQDAFEKVKEEIFEFEEQIKKKDGEETEKEAGDLIFALVNVLRLMKINPEVALCSTIDKFINRFNYIELNAKEELDRLSLEQMDILWERAKKSGL